VVEQVYFPYVFVIYETNNGIKMELENDA